MTNTEPSRFRRNKDVDLLHVPRENVVDLRRLSSSAAPAPYAVQPQKRAGAPSVRRRALTFSLLVLLAVLPFFATSLLRTAGTVKGDVTTSSSEAFDALVRAGEALAALQIDEAQSAFASAAGSFGAARESIGQFRVLTETAAAVLPFAGTIASDQHLLEAGTHLAKAGELLAVLLEPWVQPASTPQDFSTLLGKTEQTLQPTLAELDAAVASLGAVRVKDLPEEHRAQLTMLLERLPAVQASLQRIRSVAGFVLDVLGTRRTQRYLVLFQNNLEVRATGGFLGSMALIDVAGGKLTKLTVPGGGTYDVQGQLSEKRIAPEPLHLVNPHWQLQDANWWPDFPASAKKVMWFYEKSGGPTVDGVLALTPNVVLDVLRATGPVDFTATYGVTITAENFLTEVLQQIDERSEKPKQIISDLVPVILDRLVRAPTDDPAALLGLLERALAEKHLLFSFSDAQREEHVRELGWGGDVRAASRDYLQVVDTNIGGGKTDGVIDETIDHRAEIAQDGTVTATVTVTRVHYGIPNDPFTGTRNVDYVRFYVPQGSTLLGAEGFERIDPYRFQVADTDAVADDDQAAVEGRPVVDELTGVRTSEEFGKTVFGHWMGVAPGETVRASITYRLPFRVAVRKGLFRTQTGEYALLVQKQPGVDRRFLTHTLTYPASYRVRWQSADQATLSATPTSFSTAQPLTGDQFSAVLFEPAE